MSEQTVSRLKVAIVGVGLMGGSLAAALKKFVPGAGVYGVDTPETLEKAKELGHIDTAVPSVKELPEDLDILFLAAPISVIYLTWWRFPWSILSAAMKKANSSTNWPPAGTAT